MNQTVSDDIDEEIHNCFLYQNKLKSLNKILPLVLVLSISLIMGNQIPDAFGAKPQSITVKYNGVGGTLHVEEKKTGTPTSITDPCGGAAPCAADFAVLDGDEIKVFSASGVGNDLATNTNFFIDGTPFVFTNKGGPELHTSCSAQLVGSIGTSNGDTITVLSQQGGSGSGCPDPPPDIVGGHGGPIDKTSLLVTGAQLNASWMIPVLVSAIGIGLFVVTRKS